MKINRGSRNLTKLGEVIEYNEKEDLAMWNDANCDEFNGASDGSVFHPFMNKKGKDTLSIISTDTCRRIELHYDSFMLEFARALNLNIEKIVRDDRKSLKIKMYLFLILDMKFLRYVADVGIDPQNDERDKCYCKSPNKCLGKGAYDLYKCTGIPLVLTNPHFYNADLNFLDRVVGLSPEKVDFFTFVILSLAVAIREIPIMYNNI